MRPQAHRVRRIRLPMRSAVVISVVAERYSPHTTTRGAREWEPPRDEATRRGVDVAEYRRTGRADSAVGDISPEIVRPGPAADSPVGDRAVAAAEMLLRDRAGSRRAWRAPRPPRRRGRARRARAAAARPARSGPGRRPCRRTPGPRSGSVRYSSQAKFGTAAARWTDAAVQTGPERVVRHQVDVVRLAPAGDLHRLGEAADVADVDARELRRARARCTAGTATCSGTPRRSRTGTSTMRAERLVGLRRLVADRLLEEVERARRHPLAERRRLGDRQPVVVVDRRAMTSGPTRLAQPRSQRRRRRRSTRAARRRVPPAVSSGAWIHVRTTFQPCATSSLRVLDQSPGPSALGRREERHVVAMLAAEQLVDRHAERLAADVVERDVDRRDGGGERRGRPRSTGSSGTSPARARRLCIGSRPTRNCPSGDRSRRSPPARGPTSPDSPQP